MNVSNDAMILKEHTYSIPDNSLSVKLVYINVCGLLSKLRYPDFEEFCQSYDIICLAESKLGSFDSFDIQNFSILHLINRKQAKIRSGGIAVLVKDTIFEHVKVLNSSSENVLWFTVNNSLLHELVLFGVVYIPPESSSYSNISIFGSIENDIITLNPENNHRICLIGDFNAHTSNADDFIYVNEYICDNFNLDDVTKQVLHKSLLEDLGITTTRYNSDKSKIDNYGSRLLSLCKSFDIHIANGRLFKDRGIGAATCKNTTVVDYCIMSPELFSYVSNFEILPFDPLLSDVHNGIAVEFLSKPVQADVFEVEEQPTKKCKWSNEKKETFINSLDLLSVLELEHKMSDILSTDCANVNQTIIDSLVENCNKILLDAASESDMFFNTKHKKATVKKIKKPWFNRDCFIKRKEYFKARNLSWRTKSAENRTNLIRCSKAYKKEINKQYNAYRKDFISKLRSMKTKDPKSYWSLINKSTEKQKSVVNKVALETFYDHFKNLSNENNEPDAFIFDIENVDINDNNELNRPFSEADILQAIKSLKNNKSCGTDLILNEFLKCASGKMLNVFCKLFNIVFESGIVPNSWTEGIICPIYKNKGDVNDPDNYRGITILSCFGKLFTSVLNNRLNCFLESMNVLCEEQAGFRKGYSTMDHVFNLKCLVDLYLHRNKHLFCAFIDYRKAFDSVNRLALWQKLLQQNVNGKMLKIIYSMYDSAKSCVRQNQHLSNYFFSNVGVRQGENLSPILFSLFLNDLVEFISHGFDGLTNITEAIHLFCDTDDVEVYFKLYLLLYADDTVILAESQEQLQAALNSMYLYCQTWKLQVNPAKTKVVIFSKRKIKEKPVFTYNGETLAVVDDFVYLGVTFTRNASFVKHKKHLLEQGRKAMFSVLRKTRKLDLPVDMQLQMFDCMVVPILLYGAEIYGYEKSDIIESLFLQFYKIIMCFKKCTPNAILYGELERYPADILIKSRMVGFWKRLVCGKQDKISCILYNLMYKLHTGNFYFSKWLNCVESTLNNCGFSEYWIHQNVPVNYCLAKMVKSRLIDQFKQNWYNSVFDLSKCLNYRIFKRNHCFENYLSMLPTDLRISLSKFRCMNHNLPIEKGRYIGIARDDRICNLCNSANLGDEYHYIFECHFLKSQRKKFIPIEYYKKHNIQKYHDLFNSTDYNTILRLAKFCKIILKLFK